MKDGKTMPGPLRAAGLWLWHLVSNNVWYKLLAILIAVLLWSYAISSNPSLTIDRTLSNIEIEISGTSVLTSRKLALLTDLSTETQLCQVRVTAPRANALQVNSDNVHVELDLSTVRNPGRQKVRLKGNSLYGAVQQISPAEIEVEIDTFDSRSVPVIVQQTGTKSDVLWVNERHNPMSIVVSGPSQLVRQASQAVVQIDMTDRTESDSRAEPFLVIDTDGRELPSWLTVSSSSVTVNIDIYPTKMLPVSANIDEILDGEPPRGFSNVSIAEVQPLQIRVAADKVLLDSLTSVAIEPIDITGRTSPFTANAKVKKLADVKNYSAESVNVSVSIIEDTVSKTYSNMSAKLNGLPSGLRAKWTSGSSPRLTVVVSGLFTAMQDIARADVSAWVDLSEITEPGTHELPIQVAVDNFPELSCMPSPETAKVTITKQ